MKQLILCVETNKKAATDPMYIDVVIKYLYNINSGIKLQYKYFDGKGKYRNKKLLEEIKRDQKTLPAGSSSDVVYFIDTDKYDSDADDQRLNDEIQEFCRIRGYKLVWFCRDVEEVFLHKTVMDSKKKEEATKFKLGNNLGKASISTLSARSMSRQKSNMLLVMNQLLERK